MVDVLQWHAKTSLRTKMFKPFHMIFVFERPYFGRPQLADHLLHLLQLYTTGEQSILKGIFEISYIILWKDRTDVNREELCIRPNIICPLSHHDLTSCPHSPFGRLCHRGLRRRRGSCHGTIEIKNLYALLSNCFLKPQKWIPRNPMALQHPKV